MRFHVTALPALVFCALALLLPAACGQLPRPFQPPAKSVDLKQLNHEATIVVLPLAGVPSSPGFNERLVTALQERGFRATQRLDGGANQLGGAAQLTPLPGGQEMLRLSLSLSDATGREVASLREEERLAMGAWEDAGPDAFATLAERTAGALAEQLNADSGTQVADVLRGRVVVMPVVGPDGSVDERLTGALKAQLRRRSIALAGVPGPRDVTVEGAVSIDLLEPGWQQVALVWRVVDAADGEELGTVDQGNTVPEGALDEGFGPNTSLVAAGAAEGISQILQELEIDYFN